MNQPPKSQAVAKTAPPIVQVAELFKAHRKAIEDALPRHVTCDRMIRIALTELRRTPKLQQCDPLSFLGAVVQASQLGLEPGGGLGHVYLIPYGKEAQLQIGYRGMVDLARRSGNISSLEAHCVFEGDDFDFEFGLESHLKHRPRFKSQDVTHVYAVAKLRDGGVQFDIMDRREVDHIRDTYSVGYRNNPKSSPWTISYQEMAKKTVIRRIFKMLPTSIELRDALRLDDEEVQHNAKLIDPNYEVPPATVDLERFHAATAAETAPLDTPAHRAALDSDRKMAIEEFQTAVANAKKAGKDVEKILGKKINDLLINGDTNQLLGAVDALNLWEGP